MRSSAAARVVVTSEATARIVMADYDVPSQRISVVRPGNDPVPPAPGSDGGVVRLLSVGSVVPVKGYDLLIAAVATLTDMPWRLTIAGDPGGTAFAGTCSRPTLLWLRFHRERAQCAKETIIRRQ